MRVKRWLKPAGFMLFLLQAPWALAQVRGYEGGHGMMMGWGYGGGWLGAVLFTVFWVVVIVGLVALIRWLWAAGNRGRTGNEDAPLEILRRRYARGEINKEEFEQKKRDLGA